MSGICGIVFPPDRSVAREDVACILQPLERRGPDGSHVALCGRAGLGHALLATTPEALIETQPLRHPPTGCTITADVRLDNREELAGRLGQPEQGTGDGAMILLAYLRWGERCLEYLRGDFAFAIWDPREATLFCARDQTGMRQLIYHHTPGKIFAFATEPRALVRHPEVPLEINEARVGDFLEHLEAHDLESTFYSGLYKLPPAHALILAKDGLRMSRYWRLEPQPLLQLRSDADYAAAFRKVLADAVRPRLRSPEPVGCMLSGGLDSGSVAAIAAGLTEQSGQAPLKTFSATTDDPECEEANAIRACLAIEHIDPTLVSLKDFERYRAALTQAAEEIEEPFDWYMNIIRAVYLAAQAKGIKVMLDGVGGDTTLGTGSVVTSYLNERRFLSALREMRGDRRFWGEAAPSWLANSKALLRSVLPEPIRDARRNRYRKAMLAELAKDAPLVPDCAARIDMHRRRLEYFETIAEPTDPDERKAKRPLHPHVIVARERYDRVASAFGIEPRDPFLDLRMIDFCLSLPTEQLQKYGWPKLVMRRAMNGMLPDRVLWRTGRMHFGSDFTGELWSGHSVMLDPDERRALQPFVKPALLHAEASGPDKGSVFDHEDELEEVLRLRYCASWLIRANAYVRPRSFQ